MNAGCEARSQGAVLRRRVWRRPLFDEECGQPFDELVRNGLAERESRRTLAGDVRRELLPYCLIRSWERVEADVVFPGCEVHQRLASRVIVGIWYRIVSPAPGTALWIACRTSSRML